MNSCWIIILLLLLCNNKEDHKACEPKFGGHYDK
jgi:hypothetical protein